MTWEPREETMDLAGGLGLLRLGGDEFETGLVFDGAPIALMWNDNEGSVGQMLAYAGVLELSAELKQLRRAADGHLDPEAPLWSQIYPLLRLFEDGPYLLREEQADTTWSVVSPGGASPIHRFYPMDDFVVTRPDHTLDRSRIDDFVDRIRGGASPVVFCASTTSSWARLVVDGHHKLRAYEACRVAPRFVEIVAQRPAPLSEPVERRFFVDPAGYRDLLAARARARG